MTIALILAATAAFGGLDAVDPKVAPFKAGEEFSDGEFTVIVDRTKLVHDIRGGRVLATRIRVDNSRDGPEFR